MEDLARSLGIAPAAPSPSSASSSSHMSTRPTRREARDILRHLGVPVASESDILWISTPTPYRAGRPRLVVLTSHMLVYLRGLDQFQAAYNRAMDAKKTWDIDWTGAVENLAYAGEAWDDAAEMNGANNNNNASPLAPPDARRGGQQVHPIAHVHEPGGPTHYEHPPRCQRHRRRSHGASQRPLPAEGRVARRPELDANEVRIVYFNSRTRRTGN